MTGITRQLAECIASISFDHVPAESVKTVKRGAIIRIGVLLAGRDEPVVDIARPLAGVDGAQDSVLVARHSNTASAGTP